MIEAELPGLDATYRSRPAVVHATSAPLAWFGRARVAALLLVAGAVLPWSIVMIRSQRAVIACLFVSILLSCAGTWLLTAGSPGFPFDDPRSGRVRRLARGLAATELILWLQVLVDWVQFLSVFVWMPILVAVHLGVVSTRLLTLRWVHERIGAAQSARNHTALLKAYVFSASWLLLCFPASFVDQTFMSVCGSIGLLGLLVVYVLGCTSLLFGADRLCIVLEQRWVRISSAAGQHWAVLALLRGGHALVLLPLEPPRAFESGVEAQLWLFQERYADPARVDAVHGASTRSP